MLILSLTRIIYSPHNTTISFLIFYNNILHKYMGWNVIGHVLIYVIPYSHIYLRWIVNNSDRKTVMNFHSSWCIRYCNMCAQEVSAIGIIFLFSFNSFWFVCHSSSSRLKQEHDCKHIWLMAVATTDTETINTKGFFAFCIIVLIKNFPFNFWIKIAHMPSIHLA